MKSKLADRIVLVAAISVLVIGSAQAFVVGPTNLSFMGYPEHNCHQPIRPYSNDRYAWESFQSDAEEYVDCINDYVEAGNNDARRIRDAQDDALREARAFANSLR
jgi:hypothetical protein